MKTIMKYVYVALLLIGLGSCTQNDWTPGAPESKECYNVYFPEQEISGSIEVNPTDALEFTVSICRENIEGDIVVPLNIDLNTEGKFTVSEALFYDGSDEAEITITLADDAKVGVTYDLGISVTDPRFVPQYTSDASKPLSHRLSITRVTWRSLGKVDYTDDIIYPALMNGETVTYPVELQVREDTVKDINALLAAKEGNGSDAAMAGIYRLVNPYNEGPFKGDIKIGKYDITHSGKEDSYLVINAEKIDQVYIPRCEMDLIVGGETKGTYIYSLAAYEMDANGKNPLELDSRYFGAIRYGSIVFDYDVILYALSNRVENTYEGGNTNYEFRVAISPVAEVPVLDMPYFDDGDFTFTTVSADKTFYSEARQEIRSGVVLEKGEPNVTAGNIHREFYNSYGTLYRLVNPYDTTNAGRSIPIYFCYKDGKFVVHPDYQYQLTGHVEGGMYVYFKLDTEKSTFDTESGDLQLVGDFFGGDMYYLYFNYGSYREGLATKVPDFMSGDSESGVLNFEKDFTYTAVFTDKFSSQFNSNNTREATFEKGICNDIKKAKEFEKEYSGVYRIRNAYADGYDIYFCADKKGNVVLPKSIGMQKMGTQIFGVDVYTTIVGGTVDPKYGCFLKSMFTNAAGYDVSAVYPASYGYTAKETLWHYVWNQIGTASYRSMFHYDEIGIEVPDKGLKVFKTENLNYYRVEDYLRQKGSDVDLEFYLNTTTKKAELPGILDTGVLFGTVAPNSKYADYTFSIMDGLGYANDMYGQGMTWDEIVSSLQIAQSGYDATTRELAFNLIYYVSGYGFYPNEGSLSPEILKFDAGINLDPEKVEEEEKKEEVTPSNPDMPQVSMSSISTERFVKAVKRDIVLGRAFVPVAPNNGGMANAVAQPYTKEKIAVK